MNQPQPEDRPPPRPLTTGRVMGVSSTLIATLLVAAGVGWLIDQHFGTWPIITLILAPFFIASGLWQIYKEFGRR